MNRTPRTRPAARVLAVVLVGAAALAACGGGDDDAVEAPGDGGNAPASTAPLTVPPEYEPAIRPVEVTGDPLPALAGVAPEDDPAVGRPAPVLAGEDYTGNAVRVEPATTGPTMVVFVAHWCPHCNAEIPRLTQLRDEGRLPADLNIVAVATASDPSRPNFPPADWLVDMDWSWPVIADDIDLESAAWVAADAYGVDGFPFVTLVGADGNVAARWSGESEPDVIVARISQYLGL